MADRDLSALEDNYLNRSKPLQAKIGKTLDDLKMEMSGFVGGG